MKPKAFFAISIITVVAANAVNFNNAFACENNTTEVKQIDQQLELDNNNISEFQVVDENVESSETAKESTDVAYKNSKNDLLKEVDDALKKSILTESEVIKSEQNNLDNSKPEIKPSSIQIISLPTFMNPIQQISDISDYVVKKIISTDTDETANGNDDNSSVDPAYSTPEVMQANKWTNITKAIITLVGVFGMVLLGTWIRSISKTKKAKD